MSYLPSIFLHLISFNTVNKALILFKLIMLHKLQSTPNHKHIFSVFTSTFA